MAVYRRHLLQLEEALRSENDRQRTRQILADLLGQVTLLRDEVTIVKPIKSMGYIKINQCQKHDAK